MILSSKCKSSKPEGGRRDGHSHTIYILKHKTVQCVRSSVLTFEEIWVVFAIRAEEVEFFGLGLGGQDGDGVADIVDGDSIGGRNLSWKSHLCL